ncbi:MAG: nucleotide exchange factor GrpE, partial [Planctomycetota bacterium]
FDPNFHQAVQMQPSDEFAANTVMQELRTGYRLHDRVIRPSQVFVSTGSSS